MTAPTFSFMGLGDAEKVGGAKADSPPASRHWYIVHTYSGFEKKVSDSLKPVSYTHLTLPTNREV